MRSWTIYLYDSLQELLDDSGIQTNSTIEYSFTGFESDVTYYYLIQATAINGLIATTGMIEFTPSFAQPTLRVNLTLENTPDAGIKATWDAFQIIGHGTDYSFIGGEEVDVTAGDVIFDSGFLIENNFTYKEWLRGVTNYEFNIVLNATLVASNTAPANTDYLWLEDTSLSGETPLSNVASAVAPSNTNYLWLEDTSLVVDRIMTINADIVAPTVNPETKLWIDLGLNLESVTLATLTGDEGSYYLRYFDSTFYLYENDNIVASAPASGTSFYVLIQQINGTPTLTATALS